MNKPDYDVRQINECEINITDMSTRARVWETVDGYWHVAVRGTHRQPRFRTSEAAVAHAMRELRRIDRAYTRSCR